jgi:glucose/arabinose dehydrogenase
MTARSTDDRRRPLLAGMALAGLALVAALVAAFVVLRGPGGPALETRVIQAGLANPWDLDFLPDGRMVVTERPGRVRLYAGGEPSAELLSTFEVPDLRAEGEAGLMGIAVDTDFAANPYVYVCASLDTDGEAGGAPWHNAILRYTVPEDGNLTDGRVLFNEPMTAAFHHNGCAVEMDAGRHLWFTMGDGNIPAAEINPAQDPASLNGKVLRLAADGSIPDDNPILPGTDAPSAVWSMGHRNPQGLTIAPDGSVYIAEHGNLTDDELNRVVAGGNFGYACFTDTDHPGPARDGSAAAGCADASAYLPPLWASGSSTLATSGIRYLGGADWGSWEGSLLVTTLKEQDLRRFELRDGATRAEHVEMLFDDEFGRLRAIAIGPDGALYLTTSNGPNATGEQPANDMIIRVTPRR